MEDTLSFPRVPLNSIGLYERSSLVTWGRVRMGEGCRCW